MNFPDDDESRRKKSSFDEDIEEDDVQSEVGDPGAMMSLFASYYGIDSSSQSQNARTPGDLIDSACFDPDAFVKVNSETSVIHSLSTSFLIGVFP
jgi:hypothetical protein